MRADIQTWERWFLSVSPFPIESTPRRYESPAAALAAAKCARHQAGTSTVTLAISRRVPHPNWIQEMTEHSSDKEVQQGRAKNLKILLIRCKIGVLPQKLCVWEPESWGWLTVTGVDGPGHWWMLPESRRHRVICKVSVLARLHAVLLVFLFLVLYQPG